MLDEWASEVCRRFQGKVSVVSSTQNTINHDIATATFWLTVDPRVKATDVTAYTHKIGMKYARDSRYFFIFDKNKSFLFLLIYPYDSGRKMNYLHDSG